MSVSSVGSRPTDTASPGESSDPSMPGALQRDPPQPAPQPAKPDDADAPHTPSIPTQLSVNSQTDAAALSSDAAKQDVTVLQGATADELDRLNTTYDANDISSTRNQDNASSARELNDINMTGRPGYAKAFQNQLPGLQAQIADLPDDAVREQNLAQLSMFSVAFENAAEPSQRAAIVKQFESFRQAISDEHDDTQSDPVKHAESIFTQPFGSGYLDAEGKRGVERLDNLRDNFERATTPGEREAAMNQAAALKRALQSKIADGIDGKVDAARLARQKTFGEVIERLKEASGMTIYGTGDDSPKRLEYFGAMLNDEQHALAFTELMRMSPDGFSKLRQWEDRTRHMDADAERAEQGHLFHRFELPPFSSFSDVLKNPPLPNDDYGKNLLAEYQWAQRRLVAAERRINVQGKTDLDPPRREYLTAYSPPPPEWQQELDEAFCRLTVGAMPVANLFTNSICPHSHLNDTARTFIDIGAGVLGTALGYKMPEVDIAGPALKGGMSRAGALLDMLRKPKAIEMAAPGAAEIAQAASSAKAPPLSQLDSASARINGPQPLPSSYRYDTPIAQSTPGTTPGVMVDPRGQRFISMDGQTYAVKYDKDNGTWRVFDQSNPWRPSFPVRLDEQGLWEPHSSTGLAGGVRPLSPERAQAILEDLMSHPGDSYTAIAQRHDVATITVRRVADRNNVVRLPRSSLDTRSSVTAPITTRQRQIIVDNLRSHPGDTYRTIAERHGVGTSSVANIAKEHDIKRHPFIDAEKVQAIVADLRDTGDSYAAIGQQHDVSATTARKIDLRYRVRQDNPIKPRTPTTRRQPQIDPDERREEQAIVEYLRNQPTQNYSTVAGHFKVPVLRVSRLARSNALERRINPRLSWDKVESAYRYVTQHANDRTESIARELGVSWSTAARVRRNMLKDREMQAGPVITRAETKSNVIRDLSETSLTDHEIAQRNGTTVREVRMISRTFGLRGDTPIPAATTSAALPQAPAQGEPVAGSSRAFSPSHLSEADTAQIERLMESWLKPEHMASMLDLDVNVVTDYVRQIAPDYAATGYFPYNRPSVSQALPVEPASRTSSPSSLLSPLPIPSLSHEDQAIVRMLMGEGYRLTPQAIANWIEQPLNVVEPYIRSIDPSYPHPSA
ncbi:hypothetical protein [Caballeronia sp. LZ035]|uniref:hypothetical protein n=1 Tax=Caballeronia sp. LZ035 TaxID=3038568 RepID=UPI00285CE81E|nr:hypothetical protein [Caballeronia sp. LZ035]MDR5761575.1 hypothetical protein [Caballeronia sp. LZ035]